MTVATLLAPFTDAVHAPVATDLGSGARERAAVGSGTGAFGEGAFGDGGCGDFVDGWSVF